MKKKYDSILCSIKKLIGIADEESHFDPDIIMDINSALSILTQAGVGPPEGFKIEDKNATWTDFIGDRKDLDDIKSFVYLRVKLLFDNSTLSSSVIETLKQQADEFLWRINVAAETKEVQNG